MEVLHFYKKKKKVTESYIPILNTYETNHQYKYSDHEIKDYLFNQNK